MDQWLRPHTSNAEGMGSIPGRVTKIPHTVQHGQENLKKFFKKNLHIELIALTSITHPFFKKHLPFNFLTRKYLIFKCSQT